MKRLWLVVAALNLAAGPASARDMMQYGRAYLAEGDNAAAVQSYTEGLRLNPFDPVALNNLAVAKAAAGDYQAARDLLVRAEKLAPNRADIRENLASLQSWMESYGGVPGALLQRPALNLPRTAAVLPEPPALWPALRSRSSSATLPAPAPIR